jgi:hypothetical protein
MFGTNKLCMKGIYLPTFQRTGSSMPISSSKLRDLAEENNKILTEWK